MQTHHPLTRVLPVPLRNPAHRVWTFGQDIIRCDLIKQASAMAYVTLLSLIPSLVAIFCVLSLFAPLLGNGTSLIGEARDFLLENLASDSGEAVVKYLDNMLSHLNLASIGWSSFASVLVTLVLLLRQIEEALNRIWLVHKGRNIFTRFMYFWTFLTLGMVVLAVAVGASAGFSLPTFLTSAPDGQPSALAWLGSWIAGLTGGFVFFFFLYKVVPNCYVGARNAAIGAAVASLVLHIGGRVYGLYVANAKNYQTLYGAMAQLPLFLTWLYICWIIILVGALISWRLQEGFPRLSEEDTLGGAKTALEQLRNAQVKAALPLLSLLAIYKQFDSGSGQGLSGQALAHALKMPVIWVSDALQALQTLGYVIAGKDGNASSGAMLVTDPFFPSMPAQSLPMTKVSSDLASPMENWLSQWHHELPLDLHKALQQLAGTAVKSGTMADVLARL